MHTTAINPTGTQAPVQTKTAWHFNHNGDLSGDVLIAAPGSNRADDFAIPYAVLAAFVGCCERDRQIAMLEDMDGRAFLKRCLR